VHFVIPGFVEDGAKGIGACILLRYGGGEVVDGVVAAVLYPEFDQLFREVADVVVDVGDKVGRGVVASGIS
jgi:hypothetical protein